MNNEKYLPIGTVIMLKGGEKRCMIIGFCTTTADDDSMYDYCGCLYPEGVLSSDQTLMFNHDQIEKIYYLGFVDEEEKEFKTKLNEVINTIGINNSENVNSPQINTLNNVETNNKIDNTLNEENNINMNNLNEFNINNGINHSMSSDNESIIDFE